MPHLFLNGIQVNYQRAGRGPAVVLIHGYTSSLAMWAPQFPALAADYDVIAYDVRGHGDTEHCYDGHDLDTLVADLGALLDSLGLESAHVVGLSMGGIIAQRFALDHPGRMRTLTVAASFPGRPDPGIVDTFFFHLNIVAEKGLPGLFQYLLSHPALPLGPDFSVPFELMKTYQEHFLKNDPLTMSYFIQMLNALPDWSAELGRINCPALLMVGDLDMPCLAAMKNIARAIAQAEFHVIEGSGHAVNLEKPEEFNRLLLAFLENHGR